MPTQSYIGLKQLLIQIQTQVRASFPSTYWVKGEVAGIRKTGGHVYFDLIELSRGTKVAQIKACAFWGDGTEAIAGFERATGQKFTEGIKIGVRVAISYHPVYGLSLVLHEIDAELTLGGIELQRRQTLKKLLADHPGIIQFRDGQFITPNKRLRLPRAIQRIALITSANSDAYNDFMHCLSSNDFHYKFIVDEYNVLVHGYSAQSSLFNAIGKIRTSKVKYDVIVITRGGGAPADFLPFDDYHLALEVAQCPFPIITGIGHHMNQGITDYFARVHTKTPSIAAQFILDHNNRFENKIRELSDLIKRNGNRILVSHAQQFDALKQEMQQAVDTLLEDSFLKVGSMNSAIFPGARQLLLNRKSTLFNRQLYLNSTAKSILHIYDKGLSEKSLALTFMPRQMIRREKHDVLRLQNQLVQRIPQYFDAKSRELNGFKKNIQNLSPDKIVKRGFAILKKEGKILSSSDDVRPGDSIQVIHGRSLIDTTVNNKENYNGTEFNV